MVLCFTLTVFSLLFFIFRVNEYKNKSDFRFVSIISAAAAAPLACKAYKTIIMTDLLISKNHFVLECVCVYVEMTFKMLYTDGLIFLLAHCVEVKKHIIIIII